MAGTRCEEWGPGQGKGTARPRAGTPPSRNYKFVVRPPTRPGPPRDRPRRRAWLTRGQGDGLGLEVLLEALDAVLSPHAALAVPAEGDVGSVPEPPVHHEGAGPHAPGDVHGTLLRRARDGARQSVDGVVGNAHGVVVVFEGDNRQHGAEDLLLGDGGGGVDVGEQGGLHEEALGEVGGNGPPPHQPGSFGLALVDVAHHPVALLGADERALEVGGVPRIAVGDAGHHGVGELEEFVVATSGGAAAGW